MFGVTSWPMSPPPPPLLPRRMIKLPVPLNLQPSQPPPLHPQLLLPADQDPTPSQSNHPKPRQASSLKQAHSTPQSPVDPPSPKHPPLTNSNAPHCYSHSPFLAQLLLQRLPTLPLLPRHVTPWQSPQTEWHSDGDEMKQVN